VKRFVIVGGAGFIGSHFADRLLASPEIEEVVLYDNFSSGQEWHYAHHAGDQRLSVIRADVHERGKLIEAFRGRDVVIHLASNPDIARAISEPDIDFREGTELTNHVVEAMRVSGLRRILYASGSGVYGELGALDIAEDHGPLMPISTYGASKLAGEALICAYAHMFDFRACVFRFANVVGRRQTHGVGFDFVRRLRSDPTKLRILGDGTQSKGYVHVDDVVSAVLLALHRSTVTYDAFNVGTGDAITVKEIADLACDIVGARAQYEFAGGDRGWKGDVPVVRLAIDKIKALGWAPTRTSSEALRDAMTAMLRDLES
jgi:UDP-glucose 4-epimerase